MLFNGQYIGRNTSAIRTMQQKYHFPFENHSMYHILFFCNPLCVGVLGLFGTTIFMFLAYMYTQICIATLNNQQTLQAIGKTKFLFYNDLCICDTFSNFAFCRLLHALVLVTWTLVLKHISSQEVFSMSKFEVKIQKISKH